MDKRLIPGSFIRDRLRYDDNFYIIVNSHDKDSERLSEHGVRTGWRNALPMRLELPGGLWEVASLQLQMQNVQKIHHRLTLSEWDDPDTVTVDDVPLQPSASLSGLSILDGVFRSLSNDKHYLEEECYARLYRGELWHGFTKYPNISSEEILKDAQAGMGTFDFVSKHFTGHTNDYYTVQHPADGSEPPLEDFFEFKDRGAYHGSKNPKYTHWNNRHILTDGYHVEFYEGIRNFYRTTFCMTPALASAMWAYKQNERTVTRPSDGREFLVFDTYYMVFELHRLDETLFKSRPIISLERGNDGKSLEIHCEKKIDLISADGGRYTVPRFMAFEDEKKFFAEMDHVVDVFRSQTVKHVDFFVTNLEFEVPARDSQGAEVQGRLDAMIDLEAHTDDVSRQMNYLPNRANAKYHALKRVNATSLDLKIASSFPGKFDPTFLTGPVTAVLHFRKDLIDSHHGRHVPF